MNKKTFFFLNRMFSLCYHFPLAFPWAFSLQQLVINDRSTALLSQSIHFTWHKKPLMIPSDWLFAHFSQPDYIEYTFSQISISKNFCNKPVLSEIVTGGPIILCLIPCFMDKNVYWFVTFEDFNSHWMLFAIGGK